MLQHYYNKFSFQIKRSPKIYNRLEIFNNHTWRRVLEVIIVVLLTGTAAVCLPAAFMCKQELRTVMMEDSAGCLNAEDQFQLSHGTVSQ